MSLEVRLHHDFAAARIEVEFAAPGQGVTALFGPSGSGKSTVIAAVAGLLRPQQCRIEAGGVLLADIEAGIWTPPERRHIGMVFQDARLFPHMTVATNLRFGMRRTAERRIGFDEVVDLLDIRKLLPRRPNTLSGGERQRVAIGRALLAQPHLLLMDEPLASLDAARKAEILPYLARLKEQSVPILYVTHAFDELLGLADWVVLLDAGSVVASGRLDEIATRPDLPLARRDDAGAVLACHIGAHDPARGLTRLDWGDTPLWMAQLAHPEGSALRLRLPAREVILARPDVANLGDVLSLHNILAGTVRAGGDRPGPPDLAGRDCNTGRPAAVAGDARRGGAARLAARHAGRRPVQGGVAGDTGTSPVTPPKEQPMSEHPAFAPRGVAVITGAASGIGLAAAHRLAGLGMKLCLADIDAAALDRAAGTISGEVVAVPTDVSSRAAVEHLHERARSALGDVAVLMNNAGRESGDGRVLAPEGGSWQATLDINLWGVINGVQVFGPGMIARLRPGAIINTGSKQGITTPPGNAAYNVSKAGVKVVTEALAHELRNTAGCQVTAHLLIPGFTFTGFTRVHSAEKPDAAWLPEQVIDFMLQRVAAGDFYILCPDCAVTREMDERRIRWASEDIIQNRPPLSRWHPDHVEAFTDYMAAR